MASDQTIPLAARTTYSEILERVLASPAAIAGLLGAGGSFVKKVIASKVYLYYQWREQGRTRQHYLGPATAQRMAAIGEFVKQGDDLRALVRMVVSGGGAGMEREGFRYLSELAAAGVFAQGAVLVGTYAFMAYQNFLGRRWGLDVTRTLDIDLASAPRPLVVLPREARMAMDAILAQIDPAIRPLWDVFNPTDPPVSFGSTSSLRVDFLTPLIGRARSRPVAIPWLAVHALPIRFLDYLIEDAIPLVALSNRTGCLVRVPRPERFAMHKLIVADRRAGTGRSKSAKDLRQAELLLNLLHTDDRDSLEDACANLPARSAARSVRQSLDRCAGLAAALRESLKALCQNVPRPQRR